MLLQTLSTGILARNNRAGDEDALVCWPHFTDNQCSTQLNTARRSSTQLNAAQRSSTLKCIILALFLLNFEDIAKTIEMGVAVTSLGLFQRR
jgi:hypothetical protein